MIDLLSVSAYKTKCSICLQSHKKGEECPYKLEVEEYQKKLAEPFTNFHPNKFFNRYPYYRQVIRHGISRDVPVCYDCGKTLKTDYITRHRVFVLYVLYSFFNKCAYFFCSKRCVDKKSRRYVNYPKIKSRRYKSYNDETNKKYLYNDIDEEIKRGDKRVIVCFHQYGWQKTISEFLDRYYGITSGAQSP